MAEFATRLKMLRERVGMTQQELADAVGLSISTIGMYESGARQTSQGVSELPPLPQLNGAQVCEFPLILCVLQ